MATTKTPVAAKTAKGGSFLIEERLPNEVFTPEDFSGEHRQIARTTIEFTNNEVMPAAREIEAKNYETTRRLLRKAGELGLLAGEIPSAYCGLEVEWDVEASI